MAVAGVGLLELDGDLHLRPGVLDGVVHQVRHHRLQIVLVAEHLQRRAVDVPRLAVGQRVRRQVMARPRQRQALLDDRAEDRPASWLARRSLRAELAGAQHLLDRARAAGRCPRSITPVELLPLRLVDRPVLQRLQIQLHRRDRRLQLVGDGVDERLVLLVAPDLAHQEDGVEHDAGDDEGKDDEAERSAGRPRAS